MFLNCELVLASIVTLTNHSKRRLLCMAHRYYSVNSVLDIGSYKTMSKVCTIECVGKIGSHQVKVSMKNTFHHFTSLVHERF